MTKEYANLTAYLADCDKAAIQLKMSRSASIAALASRRGIDWSGAASYGDAYEMACKGWPDGLALMQPLVSDIFKRVGARIEKTRIVFRVAGGCVNVGRHLSGRPDAFQARVRSQETAGVKKNVLKMVINVGARAGVGGETIFNRGAAAVALVQALEKAGRRVEIWMVTDATNAGTASNGSNNILLKTRLKASHEAISLDKLAFCFAHQALHRQLNFTIRKAFTGWIGGSLDVDKSEQGDIYLPAAVPQTDPIWDSPARVIAWIFAQLEAQGVKLTTVS